MSKKDFIVHFIKETKDNSNGTDEIIIDKTKSDIRRDSFNPRAFDFKITSTCNFNVMKSRLNAVKDSKCNETANNTSITSVEAHYLINSPQNTHMIYLAEDMRTSNLTVLKSTDAIDTILPFMASNAVILR
jgi:hypothetical protein